MTYCPQCRSILGLGSCVQCRKVEVSEEVKVTEVKFMRAKVPISLIKEALPEGAEVYVEIPGGGDWSNTEMKVEHLVLKWKETR